MRKEGEEKNPLGIYFAKKNHIKFFCLTILINRKIAIETRAVEIMSRNVF